MRRAFLLYTVGSLKFVSGIKCFLRFFRELREKEEIEKYRMERPKIQQQFSDLKVQHLHINFIFFTFDEVENQVSGFVC